MPDLPGRIGSYEVIAKLGQGGMATVYRALQHPLRREVALKVVSPQFAADPSFRDRFLREARAGAIINHPNVVTCFDAGDHEGQLFMALELVTGGDLARLIDAKGRLDERTSLSLMLDTCRGLEAIESAGLVHRDLKPANIFLSERGQAKLADLGLVCFAQGDNRLTKPGTVMGTPAYIAPEQARGVADVDIRADIYSLGATLFHLVIGQPPFMADNPITTLVMAINDPVPDPRTLRSDLSPPLVAIIRKATEKDRERRYASARQFREDIECASAGRPPRHAQLDDTARPDAELRQKPGTEPIRKPTAGVTAREPGAAAQIAAAAAAAQRIDPVQLKALTKRIIVDPIGLHAWLVLAPGANFPRFLLEQILATAGITMGIDSCALNEATRPSQIPRRIVLAHGDPPSPGMAGRSVRGEPIPPLDEPVSIQVDDEGMEAIALTKPSSLVTKAELEPILRRSAVRFGLDTAALHRLCEGPADPTGRSIIAVGQPADPGEPAGFRLSPVVANVSIDQLSATRNLQRVSPGTVLVIWQPERPGRDGMDVFGRPRKAPPLPKRTPEECVGEGTEISRDRNGVLVLRATRSGLCQAQSDGHVRVVGAVEIAGDFGPGQPPIVTNDVVVIRGNVLAGASIQSSSDVVVLGDLSDARVTSGGDLSVTGAIGPGDQMVITGGTVIAGGVRVRRIMAGSLKISGEVRNCELMASGDISVGTVVGGILTAGGSISATVVGDRHGTTTELWAGHNLNYGQQNQLAKLEEARHDAERGRLLAEAQVLGTQLEHAQMRLQRMGMAQYVKKDALAAELADMKYLERNRNVLNEVSESNRKQLADRRKVTRELDSLSDNAKAAITVASVAHAGVVARLADVEPESLHEHRPQYRLGTT